MSLELALGMCRGRMWRTTVGHGERLVWERGAWRERRRMVPWSVAEFATVLISEVATGPRSVEKVPSGLVRRPLSSREKNDGIRAR